MHGSIGIEQIEDGWFRFFLPGRGKTKMPVGVRSYDPAARRTHHKSLLNQEWFEDVFNSVTLFPNGSRQRKDACQSGTLR